jgi:uncharacterized protein YabE (DUF348 family)/3D (Asp-Asp-Asp) domain-containing protein
MRYRPKHSARSSRIPHTIAAVVPAVIVVLSITGFMWAQKEVTVVVDGQPRCVTTQGADVAEVLKDVGVSVKKGDVVTPTVSTSVDNGDTVIVRRAVPVTLDLGTGPVEVEVVGGTVADAIVAAGADPATTASVTPALTEPLEPGMKIEVPDTFTRVVQEETTLTPEVEIRKDPLLPKGERRVVDEGAPGTLLRVYRVTVTDGVEGEPGLTAEKVVDEPEPTVIALGTGQGLKDVVNRGRLVPCAPEGGTRVRVETTAYSPRQPGLDFTTATGARAKRGVIAVDPRVIPLGTRVYVPGYGYAVARDTGGAIKGHRIDLCYDSVAECVRWGRRDVTIIVLD